MNNHAPRTLLKVDSTCLKLYENFSLIVYNINIPQFYLNDRGELSNVLDRIKERLQQDFENLTSLYQISASYILKHSESGEIRTWTGSFFARNNALGVIADFQEFNDATFVRQCLQQLSNVEEKLRANGFDTKWKFDTLLSVIFNIQCKVAPNHRLACNTRHREHKTFPL
jgi:hypothetical protein